VADEVTIVSWNTDLGAGDLQRFVAALPRSREMVLLLQEVYRGGPEVPHVLPPGAAYARRKGGAAAGARYKDQDIVAVARTLGLALYYVPSMRNGAASSEDRGNAILSSLPLDDLAAYELPFERQRRVAVSALIGGHTSTGSVWHLRVVDVHLDNTFDPRRLWLASEHGRTRQARSLLTALDEDEPLVVGGDFNTWGGFSDETYLALARRFPGGPGSDRRPTFRGLLRLDHLFFRLARGWSASFHRADDRFGSDHYPLVGTIRIEE
jgi:endonuclease/exonuclease/phosphatase family metal-dependent hydrolase